MIKKTYTVDELAARTNSKRIGNGKRIITGVSDLERAGPSDASFLANLQYTKSLATTKAGVVFVSPNTPIDTTYTFLVHDDPSRAFQEVVEMFLEEKNRYTGFEGVHPTAVIHPDTTIAKDATVGPHAVIDQGATIGAQTSIGAGCYIGPHTKIGKQCQLHPRVTVREKCEIGDRVIIQPGAVIGSCGFGYTTDNKGVHQKLNQLGNVIIEDDVEIGANTTIDRSRFHSTIIRKGTKIDNLVQIGHGVDIGEHNMLVAQTGIAGSTKTGRHVVMGGQCAVAGHLEIGDRVMLAARSGVSKSIPEPGKYGGAPIQPLMEWRRSTVLFRNLDQILKDLKKLKKDITSTT